MTNLRRSVMVLVLCLAAFLAPAGVAFALWSATATGEVTVTTSERTAAPTDFVCTDMDDDDGDGEADFDWSAVTAATEYRIYELDRGTWELRRDDIDESYANNLSRNAGEGSNDDEQVLEVTAVSPLGGESERSNQIEVDYDDSRSCGAPDTPYRPTATVDPCGEATVSWTAEAYTTSYELSWRPDASGTYITLTPPVTTTSTSVTQAQLGGNEHVQVRVRAVNAAGSSGWSSERAIDFLPPSCDPPPAPSTFYLENPGTGSTASSATLPLGTVAPTLGSLPNYDTNRDSFAGLLLAKGTGLGESSADKIQKWQVAGPLTLSGTAKVKLWSAMKDFKTDKAGTVTIGLYRCNSAGGSCSPVLASGTQSASPWSASSTWASRDWTLAPALPPTTIAADQTLQLRVVGTADDMWFAYDTAAFPSALTVGAP